MSDSTDSPIAVGTRIWNVLGFLGSGTVCAVRHTANGRFYDLAFDNGLLTADVEEAFLLGSTFRIHEDHISSPREVAEALAHALITGCNRGAADSLRQAAFRKIEAALRSDADYAFLEQADDKWTAEQATRNAAREIARAYPDLVFTVETHELDVMHIAWCDGPTADAIGKLVDKYRCFHVSPHNDLLISLPIRPWHRVFGSCRAIRLARRYSAAAMQAAIDAVFAEAGGPLAGITPPGVDDVRQDRRPAGLDDVEWQALRALVNNELARRSF